MAVTRIRLRGRRVRCPLFSPIQAVEGPLLHPVLREHPEAQAAAAVVLPVATALLARRPMGQILFSSWAFGVDRDHRWTALLAERLTHGPTRKAHGSGSAEGLRCNPPLGCSGVLALLVWPVRELESRWSLGRASRWSRRSRRYRSIARAVREPKVTIRGRR